MYSRSHPYPPSGGGQGIPLLGTTPAAEPGNGSAVAAASSAPSAAQPSAQGAGLLDQVLGIGRQQLPEQHIGLTPEVRGLMTGMFESFMAMQAKQAEQQTTMFAQILGTVIGKGNGGNNGSGSSNVGAGFVPPPGLVNTDAETLGGGNLGDATMTASDGGLKKAVVDAISKTKENIAKPTAEHFAAINSVSAAYRKKIHQLHNCGTRVIS